MILVTCIPGTGALLVGALPGDGGGVGGGAGVSLLQAAVVSVSSKQLHLAGTES
jgi:hypothetical protein